MLDLPEEKAEFFQLANKYLNAQLASQRWKLYWRIAIFSVIALSLLIGLVTSEDKPNKIKKPHVALVDIHGVIAEEQKANADSFVASLAHIEANPGAKAVLLRINSPGGSPVQASYMYNAIHRFRLKHPKIKVYAVCSETCASAAYYIATAAENIYADESSIVGSIGVVYQGFGFVNTLHRLGVERRLMTAGENKGFMDPFSPISDTQKAKFQKILDVVHEQFKAKVLAGRGQRLKVNADTFSGIFWTGAQAKPQGLIDGFASPGEVAHNILKQKRVINYSKQDNYVERILKKFGDHVANQIHVFLSNQNSRIMG